MPERYQLEVFMGMYDEKVVLCGANSYEEKYYQKKKHRVLRNSLSR